MPQISDINPFNSFSVGGVGGIGDALILFAIVVAILSLTGFLIYWRISSKAYRYKIPLYKSINGINYLQAIYVAKSIPISLAGDSLWFVKGIKRFLPPATKTSAKNVYPHEEREDGEWINFEITTVNEAQKQAGVKFIHQDMRTQRVATGQILEQRLVNKGFWDKYKDMIVHIIFYIIVTMLMIVTFWQWGNIADRTGALIGELKATADSFSQLTCVGTKEVGIIPAFLFMIFRRKK